MATLCVSYDLNAPGKNYARLIEAIKSYDNWWHYLDSTWLIITSQSPSAVRDHLSQFIDANDELLVFNVGTTWAGTGFDTKAYDWLHTNWQKS